jgi:hypothetical protein
MTLTIIQPTTSSRKIIVLQSLRLPHFKKMKRNWTLIFACDWLEIVLNKNNLIKACCYEGKIAKPELPI